MAALGYRLSVEYDVREDSTLISMVKKGLGSAITPRLVAAPIPTEIQVRSLPVPLCRAIAVAILQDTLLPRAVFAFLDILKTEPWQL
ncbi:LysR substrate-binding domain-containing protein [Vasconcelosia minhoensis]|uniref:LysR substrate-binding domain-containing protein n=1 Tax=Vasconcelosia minhoensis TaxID=3366354 RepID=UPI001D1453AF|nr:LysR substrate-binding domain-containing protein [Romeria gracilis]